MKATLTSRVNHIENWLERYEKLLEYMQKILEENKEYKKAWNQPGRIPADGFYLVLGCENPVKLVRGASVSFPWSGPIWQP